MIRRGLALLVGVPVALVLLWFLAGLVEALLPGRVAQRDGPPVVEIGLVATPIHYDLLLPLTPDLRRRFAFAEASGVRVAAPDAGWLLVGWGAREFYTSAGSYADVPLRAVLRGIAGDASVIRLEAWGDFPLADFPEITRLRLTASGYEALLARIETELGPPLPVPGLTGGDAFFAARSPFSALRTCNTWAGEALREAGMPLGAWTPTPQALRLSLWAFGE